MSGNKFREEARAEKLVHQITEKCREVLSRVRDEVWDEIESEERYINVNERMDRGRGGKDKWRRKVKNKDRDYIFSWGNDWMDLKIKESLKCFNTLLLNCTFYKNVKLFT